MLAASISSFRNTAKSSIFDAHSSAFSDTLLITVSIVPSTGSLTALYAVSFALESACATSTDKSFVFSPIPFKNPVITWESIVPEFPLAPIKTASSTVSIKSFIEVFSLVFSSISVIIEFKVIAMLLPVSPSGTG